MKTIIFLISFLITDKLFSQPSDVLYFGGMYDKVIYFNWVTHNKDTCYFSVETSENGRDFQERFCETIMPMPISVLHSITIPTDEENLWIRLVAKIGETVIDYQSAIFREGEYFKKVSIPPTKIKVVYVDL